MGTVITIVMNHSFSVSIVLQIGNGDIRISTTMSKTLSKNSSQMEDTDGSDKTTGKSILEYLSVQS